MPTPRHNLHLHPETEARLRRQAAEQGVPLVEVIRNRLVEIGRQQPEDLGPARDYKISVDHHVWTAAVKVAKTRHIPLTHLL